RYLLPFPTRRSSDLAWASAASTASWNHSQVDQPVSLSTRSWNGPSHFRSIRMGTDCTVIPPGNLLHSMDKRGEDYQGLAWPLFLEGRKPMCSERFYGPSKRVKAEKRCGKLLVDQPPGVGSKFFCNHCCFITMKNERVKAGGETALAAPKGQALERVNLSGKRRPAGRNSG